MLTTKTDRILDIATLAQLCVSAISLYLTLTVIIPLQKRSITQIADIRIDVIPSVGQLRDGNYYTQTRPVNGDITVDFCVSRPPR